MCQVGVWGCLGHNFCAAGFEISVFGIRCQHVGTETKEDRAEPKGFWRVQGLGFIVSGVGFIYSLGLGFIVHDLGGMVCGFGRMEKVAV